MAADRVALTPVEAHEFAAAAARAVLDLAPAFAEMTDDSRVVEALVAATTLLRVAADLRGGAFAVGFAAGLQPDPLPPRDPLARAADPDQPPPPSAASLKGPPA